VQQQILRFAQDDKVLLRMARFGAEAGEQGLEIGRGSIVPQCETASHGADILELAGSGDNE
jgi:hypothetical protein